jgi:hypothetical protein
MNYLMFVFDQEILSHPLFVLFVGAGLSGVIIPYATNKWKDKQRELDIKKDLVGNIAQSVMTILVYTESTLKRINEVCQILSKQNEFDNNLGHGNEAKVDP